MVGVAIIPHLVAGRREVSCPHPRAGPGTKRPGRGRKVRVAIIPHLKVGLRKDSGSERRPWNQTPASRANGACGDYPPPRVRKPSEFATPWGWLKLRTPRRMPTRVGAHKYGQVLKTEDLLRMAWLPKPHCAKPGCRQEQVRNGAVGQTN
jgi:hypothetical protein